MVSEKNDRAIVHWTEITDKLSLIDKYQSRLGIAKEKAIAAVGLRFHWGSQSTREHVLFFLVDF